MFPGISTGGGFSANTSSSAGGNDSLTNRVGNITFGSSSGIDPTMVVVGAGVVVAFIAVVAIAGSSGGRKRR